MCTRGKERGEEGGGREGTEDQEKGRGKERKKEEEELNMKKQG